MAKGGARKGAGRKKGTGNQSTEAAKLVLTEFVGSNMEDMQMLFDQIKQDDPKKAFDVLFSSLEYVIPKLARVESEQRFTDKDGNDLLEKEDIAILKQLGMWKESEK